MKEKIMPGDKFKKNQKETDSVKQAGRGSRLRTDHILATMTLRSDQ
jgi:hypothetical protein